MVFGTDSSSWATVWCILGRLDVSLYTGFVIYRFLGYKRQITSSFYDVEKPRIDMCERHEVPEQNFFPHLIKAHLQNGSTIEAMQPVPCWAVSFCE